jgi:hypothetical protein
MPDFNYLHSLTDHHSIAIVNIWVEMRCVQQKHSTNVTILHIHNISTAYQKQLYDQPYEMQTTKHSFHTVNM